MKILIIGGGVVGKNMKKIFQHADVYDIDMSETCKANINQQYYDIGFICVPTDKLKDGSCDTSIVKKAIFQHKHHVDHFCIKSTVPPFTTEDIVTEITPNVCFSPEYFGGTQHANAHEYNFVILGSPILDGETVQMVAAAYEEVYPGDLKIHFTDSRTAELVKYGENAWLAMKVSFCNEFARICDAFGCEYRNWRELWLADPRINRSHTFVYNNKPYYDSHCLNKDVPGIIKAVEKQGYVPELLINMEKYNNKHKE